MQLLNDAKEIDSQVVEIRRRIHAHPELAFKEVYYFLGTRNPRKACIHYNHSSKFRVDESVLKYGVVAHAALALHFTGSLESTQ